PAAGTTFFNRGHGGARRRHRFFFVAPSADHFDDPIVGRIDQHDLVPHHEVAIGTHHVDLGDDLVFKRAKLDLLRDLHARRYPEVGFGQYDIAVVTRDRQDARALGAGQPDLRARADARLGTA